MTDSGDDAAGGASALLSIALGACVCACAPSGADEYSVPLGATRALQQPGEPAAEGDAGATCTKSSSYRAGENRASIQHDGRTRQYVVYVPRSLAPGAAAPLVFDFHGNGGSATQEAGSSGWRQKADREGFVVVYPQGIGNAWNVGNCCGRPLSEKVDDVGFVRAVLAAVSTATCIDANRVYATGLSNGAGLAHRLACEAADVFAAISAASADLVTNPCRPVRPISELSIRGLTDRLVAYEGGNTGSTGWYSPGAKGTLALWKEIDRCTGPLETPRPYCEGYSSCANGTEVALCSLPRTGHLLYGNSLGFSVPDVSWEMFARHTLDE